MEISLLDFLSPDFLSSTITKIPGLSARGLIFSDPDIRFYYFDGIKRNKVFIEPIFKLINDIYQSYINDEMTSIFNKETTDENKFINYIYKRLLLDNHFTYKFIDNKFNEFIKQNIPNVKLYSREDIIDYFVANFSSNYIDSDIYELIYSINDGRREHDIYNYLIAFVYDRVEEIYNKHLI